jgi:hypothetical protein
MLSSEARGILFGYFQASRTQSGRNLPGQTVFTCLSHDIIAHETTHAIDNGEPLAHWSGPELLVAHRGSPVVADITTCAWIERSVGVGISAEANKSRDVLGAFAEALFALFPAAGRASVPLVSSQENCSPLTICASHRLLPTL